MLIQTVEENNHEISLINDGVIPAEASLMHPFLKGEKEGKGQRNQYFFGALNTTHCEPLIYTHVSQLFNKTKDKTDHRFFLSAYE